MIVHIYGLAGGSFKELPPAKWVLLKQATRNADPPITLEECYKFEGKQVQAMKEMEEDFSPEISQAWLLYLDSKNFGGALKPANLTGENFTRVIENFLFQ